MDGGAEGERQGEPGSKITGERKSRRKAWCGAHTPLRPTRLGSCAPALCPQEEGDQIFGPMAVWMPESLHSEPSLPEHFRSFIQQIFTYILCQRHTRSYSSARETAASLISHKYVNKSTNKHARSFFLRLSSALKKITQGNEINHDKWGCGHFKWVFREDDIWV